MIKRIILILIILLTLAGTAVAKPSGDTNHWLLYNADNAYILCADGQFIITANGADSIYIQCVPDGAQEVDK